MLASIATDQLEFCWKSKVLQSGFSFIFPLNQSNLCLLSICLFSPLCILGIDMLIVSFIHMSQNCLVFTFSEIKIVKGCPLFLIVFSFRLILLLQILFHPCLFFCLLQLDTAVLLHQNQKLSQKLEAQKIEIAVLEEKFTELRDKQKPYDNTLSAIQKSWEEVFYFIPVVGRLSMILPNTDLCSLYENRQCGPQRHANGQVDTCMDMFFHVLYSTACF